MRDVGGDLDDQVVKCWSEFHSPVHGDGQSVAIIEDHILGQVNGAIGVVHIRPIT